MLSEFQENSRGLIIAVLIRIEYPLRGPALFLAWPHPPIHTHVSARTRTHTTTRARDPPPSLARPPRTGGPLSGAEDDEPPSDKGIRVEVERQGRHRHHGSQRGPAGRHGDRGAGEGDSESDGMAEKKTR